MVAAKLNLGEGLTRVDLHRNLHAHWQNESQDVSALNNIKPDLYYEKMTATCDTRHVVATCDSNGRFILFCRKSSATSGKHT